MHSSSGETSIVRVKNLELSASLAFMLAVVINKKVAKTENSFFYSSNDKLE